MRVAVVQQAAGEAWERMLATAEPLWMHWIRQLGPISSHRTAWGIKHPERPPHWEKVAHWLDVAESLPDGALMLCADADAVPRRIENPENAMPVGCDLGMVWTDVGRCFNSGVVLIRLNVATRAWLRRIWADGPVPGQRELPGEQIRINTSLGYPEGVARKFPAREAVTVCETADGPLHVYRLNERWNAYRGARSREIPPVIQAWHGEPIEKREAAVLAARAHFDETGELWPH